RPRPRRPRRRVFPPPAPALLMPTAATRPLISATPVAAPVLGSATFYSEVLDTSGGLTARRHPGPSSTTGWQAGAARVVIDARLSAPASAASPNRTGRGRRRRAVRALTHW